MSMTLTQMETYFQQLLAEKATSSDFVETTEMDDFINEGCERYAIETKCIRPTLQTITLTSATAVYNLATDFLSMAEGVYLYKNGTYVGSLDVFDGGYDELIQKNSSNSEPSRYVIRGYSKADAGTTPTQQIIVDPPPDLSTFTIRIAYAATPLVLSTSTAISNIPAPFHRGPVLAAVALFKERDQEFDQAKYFWDRFDYWVKKGISYTQKWNIGRIGWRFTDGQYPDRSGTLRSRYYNEAWYR